MSGKDNFSLQDQIKKRKTQEMLRTIETQRVARITGNAPAVTQTETKRVSQTMRSAQAPQLPVQPVMATQTARTGNPVRKLSIAFNFRQRRNLIIMTSTLMIMAVCGVTTWIASNQLPAANMPVDPPLPSVRALQVIDYLKQTPIHLENITELAQPELPWHAQQQINFLMNSASGTTQLMLLSYDKPSSQHLDYGALALDPRFKYWAFVERANVILLMPAHTDAQVQDLLASHLTSFLEAPYRTYLPTPTPTK